MDVQDLLDKVDIVDLISEYAELEEKNGEYWCLSPLKDEKTPSFSVRRETGRFYDFSTGIGGTAITFLQYYHGISKREAIERLKKYAGVSDDTEFYDSKMSALSVFRKYAVKKSKESIGENKVLADDYMTRFEKRPEKLAVWEKEGISREVLDKFQVYYDAFSDRLVYPIRNLDGKIANVGGRTLDPNWKANGQRKYSYLFQWGSINTIYALSENMDIIKEKKEIIIFEGCKSVLLAYTWGIHNCGAILTSHLSKLQLRILVRLGCRVVFALDKDVDVLQDHNIERLKQYVTVEYIVDRQNLLDEKDSPVDKKKEVFSALYEARERLR